MAYGLKASSCDPLTSKFKCNDIEEVDRCSIDETDTHFEFDVITPNFVFDQICIFPNNKSTGIDNVCIRLLKLAVPIICHPRAYICKLSFFSLHTSLQSKKLQRLHLYTRMVIKVM